MRPAILRNMCKLFLIVENLNNHMLIHILWLVSVFLVCSVAIIVISVKIV